MKKELKIVSKTDYLMTSNELKLWPEDESFRFWNAKAEY